MITRPGVDEAKADASADEAEANHNEAEAEAEAKLQTHMLTQLFQHQHYTFHIRHHDSLLSSNTIIAFKKY